MDYCSAEEAGNCRMGLVSWGCRRDFRVQVRCLRKRSGDSVGRMHSHSHSRGYCCCDAARMPYLPPLLRNLLHTYLPDEGWASVLDVPT